AGHRRRIHRPVITENGGSSRRKNCHFAMVSRLSIGPLLVLALVANALAEAAVGDEIAIPFSVYEDPLHPIPQRVRSFADKKMKEQQLLFARMGIAEKIEVAVLIQDLNEPPDLTWESRVASVGQVALDQIARMLPDEKSE